MIPLILKSDIKSKLSPVTYGSVPRRGPFLQFTDIQYSTIEVLLKYKIKVRAFNNITIQR